MKGFVSLVQVIWIDHVWILNELQFFDRFEIWGTVEDRFEVSLGGNQGMLCI